MSLIWSQNPPAFLHTQPSVTAGDLNPPDKGTDWPETEFYGIFPQFFTSGQYQGDCLPVRSMDKFLMYPSLHNRMSYLSCLMFILKITRKDVSIVKTEENDTFFFLYPPYPFSYYSPIDGCNPLPGSMWSFGPACGLGIGEWEKELLQQAKRGTHKCCPLEGL